MQTEGLQHGDLAGQCPRCFRFGVVGTACGRHGCVEAEMHFIPAAHVHPDDPTHDGLIGRVLDRYLLVSVIGHGGFGRVYRALEMPLGMRVALKVANLEGASPEETPLLLARFEQEACALAELNHPNIVRLLRYGTFGPRPYLVMELVPGDRTLERLLLELAHKPRALSRRDIGLILFPLLDALGAAHAHGLIHRDVKPENIMLQPMPTGPPLLRLLDFGLARSLHSSNARSRPMGTPLYMAPEQLTRGPLGPWTDLYAVGMIAYELIFGARPFRGPTDRLWGQKLDRTLDPLAEAPPAPAEIVAFLRRALAADPHARFQDTESMRAALARALAAWEGDGQATHSAGPTREVGIDSRGRLMRWMDPLTTSAARPAVLAPPAPPEALAGNPTREARPALLAPPPAPDAPATPEAPQGWATLLEDDELAWFARGDAGEPADAEDAWLDAEPSAPAAASLAAAPEATASPPDEDAPLLDALPSDRDAFDLADLDDVDPGSEASDADALDDDDALPWRPRRRWPLVATFVAALAAGALTFAFGPFQEAPARGSGRALGPVHAALPTPALFLARAAEARAAHAALLGRAARCTASPDELAALASTCDGAAGCRALDGPGDLARRARVTLPDPLEPGQAVVFLMRAPATGQACGARYQRSTAWSDGAWDVLPADVGAYTQPQVVLDVRGDARHRLALAERATSRKKADAVRALLASGVAACVTAEDVGPGSASLELQPREDVRFYDRETGVTDERAASPCDLELLRVLVVTPAAS